MKNIWNCTIETVAQQDLDDLFIGGIPKLPPELSIPTCTLCSQKMSFMFQVAFPKGHIWEGKTLALFYCLDCFGHRFCIPEIPLGSSLYHVEIPAGFLDSYQRNFRVIVFDTADGVLLKNDCERVAFRKIAFHASDKNDKEATFTFGGKPIWIMGKNETPGNYATTEKLKLLFQIKEGFQFPKCENAPPQASGFYPDKRSPFPWYDLFARNRIYFWGTDARKDAKVYISVQHG